MYKLKIIGIGIIINILAIAIVYIWVNMWNDSNPKPKYQLFNTQAGYFMIMDNKIYSVNLLHSEEQVETTYEVNGIPVKKESQPIKKGK